ncbi:hypothetical protein [Paenibacillus tarimensis]|nr:hypothetical protein [Paenibacillus tarimensis]MCF2945061.1 hypothetical protein [Paenibacillus tarimensis]
MDLWHGYQQQRRWIVGVLLFGASALAVCLPAAFAEALPASSASAG